MISADDAITDLNDCCACAGALATLPTMSPSRDTLADGIFYPPIVFVKPGEPAAYESPSRIFPRFPRIDPSSLRPPVCGAAL